MKSFVLVWGILSLVFASGSGLAEAAEKDPKPSAPVEQTEDKAPPATEQALADEQAVKQLNEGADAKPKQAEAIAPEPTNPAPPKEAAGFDVALRRLGDAIGLGLKRLPGDHRDQMFALFPFDSVGEETQERQLGLVVGEQIMTDLVKEHRLNFVERSALNLIITEQSLSQTGLLDADQAVSVGGLAGAQALVVGQVIDKGDVFQVTARVVDAGNGQVFAAEQIELAKADLVAFSADAVVLRSKGAAAIRGVLIPGWGQFYNRQNVKAAFVGGAFAAAVLSAGVSAGLGASLAGSYTDWAPAEGANVTQEDQAHLADLRANANMQYSLAAALGGGAALIWLFGIIDAYVSGVDADSLDNAMADF